jgi:hypothetical protein
MRSRLECALYHCVWRGALACQGSSFSMRVCAWDHDQTTTTGSDSVSVCFLRVPRSSSRIRVCVPLPLPRVRPSETAGSELYAFICLDSSHITRRLAVAGCGRVQHARWRSLDMHVHAAAMQAAKSRLSLSSRSARVCVCVSRLQGPPLRHIAVLL